MKDRDEQISWLKGLLASGGPLTYREEDRKMVESIIQSIKSANAYQKLGEE